MTTQFRIYKDPTYYEFQVRVYEDGKENKKRWKMLNQEQE